MSMSGIRCAALTAEKSPYDWPARPVEFHEARRLTARVVFIRNPLGTPWAVRFQDEGRGYGVDAFDDLLDAGAAAYRWLMQTAV